MPTPIFKLTASDLKGKVNPTDDPSLWRYGNGPGLMPESAADDLLELEEKGFLSSLPELYRDVASGNADGVILTHVTLGAAGGETTLQLPFYPVVDGTVVLYLNYADAGKPWSARTRDEAMAAADYTVDNDTGEITLATALTKGDTVYAEYRHDGGAMFHTLRDLVLKSARNELMVMMGTWNDATNILTEARQAVDDKILSFSTGGRPRGVAEIDDVAFVTETRHNERRTRRLPYMRGAL